MVFWIVAGILTLAVCAVFAQAAVRGRVGEKAPAAYDLEVYRVQLRDVDKDVARNVLTEEEGARLRTEVSRRILAADAALQTFGVQGAQPKVAGWILAVTGSLVITGAAFGLYWVEGAPGYRDMPRELRLAVSEQLRDNRLSQAEVEARLPVELLPGPAEEPSAEFLELIERLRAVVADRPNDIQGLGFLARNEAQLGNHSAAHVAQTRLIAAKGEDATADDFAFLADLMVLAARGYVSSDAVTALREALAMNPEQEEARFYLGLYYAQVDRPDAAFRTWEKLLRESPADASWVPPIRAQIEQLADRAGVRYSLPPEEGWSQPSREQIEAAENMSPEDREEMIRGMVSGLLERLATEGGPPEDWARAISALAVIGETSQADAIWDEARGVFADNTDAMRIIADAAQEAGIIN